MDTLAAIITIAIVVLLVGLGVWLFVVAPMTVPHRHEHR